MSSTELTPNVAGAPTARVVDIHGYEEVGLQVGDL